MATIEEGEREVQMAFRRDYGSQVELSVEYLEKLLDAWFSWQAVQPGTWVEVALSLWARSFDSTNCALLLLQRGYFVQAATLIRQLDEDWLMIAYLEQHPELAAEFYKDEGNFPSFGSMAKALGSDVYDWWANDYGVLSRFSHPRGLAARSRKQGNLALIGPYYDKGIYGNFLLVLLRSQVRSTADIVKLVRKTGLKEWDARILNELFEGQQALLQATDKIEKNLPAT